MSSVKAFNAMKMIFIHILLQLRALEALGVPPMSTNDGYTAVIVCWHN